MLNDEWSIKMPVDLISPCYAMGHMELYVNGCTCLNAALGVRSTEILNGWWVFKKSNWCNEHVMICTTNCDRTKESSTAFVGICKMTLSFEVRMIVQKKTSDQVTVTSRSLDVGQIPFSPFYGPRTHEKEIEWGQYPVNILTERSWSQIDLLHGIKNAIISVLL